MLWAIARRAGQKLNLTRRSTFYERYEVVDRQGQVLERHQRGYPFVYRRGLGIAPIDLEHPVLDDGTTVSITTTGHVDEQGRWHRVIRYQRLPGQTPAPVEPQVEQIAPLSPDAQAAMLNRLLEDQRSMLPVVIQLRDQHPAHRLPPRSMTGLAFTEHHRADTMTPYRRKLRAENQTQRVREVEPLRRWIRSVGGKLGHHATLYGSILSAWIPRKHLKALLARPEVLKVEPRATDPQNEDTLIFNYICNGARSRWDSARDRNSGDCEGTATRGDDAYLDAANAATGTLDYVNAGYDGMIAGGLSNWSHEPLFTHEQVPLLTYGIRDWDPLKVDHPAFLWNGRSRFQFVLYAISDGSADDPYDYGSNDVTVYTELDIAIGTVPVPDPSSSKDAHAARCAAVAMAYPYSSSDPDLATEEARNARSGVARRVAALAATGRVQVYEMLDIINGGGLGRLRMRLYPNAQEASSTRWGTTNYLVSTGSFEVIDITDASGALPDKVRHLRITAWWLEVNTGAYRTGKEEPKADIRLTLIYWDGDGKAVFHEVACGREHVIRMQYDRDDTTFSCPPRGDVYVCLWAVSVPTDERPRAGVVGTKYDVRNVHVAWFWETIEDPTQIVCSPASASDRCERALTDPDAFDPGGDGLDDDPGGGSGDDDDDDVLTVPGDDEPAGGYSDGDALGAVAGRSGHLARMRAAADAAVRGGLRIATGIAPTAGTGPVFKT